MSGSLTDRGHPIALRLLSENNLSVMHRKMYTQMYIRYMPIRCALLMRTGASLHISELHDAKQSQFTRVHKHL